MAQTFGAVPDKGLRDDLGNALTQSVDEFKALLDTNHVWDFEKATSRDVYWDLQAIQFQRQEKRTMMNLGRIQMFLDGMDGLQDALEELEPSKAASIMAYVWGPMRFLLKVTTVNDKAFDEILEVYQRLGLDIPPLEEYKQFFADSLDARRCLLHLYRDVLEFHRLAYKLFSLRTLWTRLHRATWRDLESTFAHLASSIALHAEFIRTHGRRVHHDRLPLLRAVDSGFAAPPPSPPPPRPPPPGSGPGPGPADHDFRRGYQQYEVAYATSWRQFRQREIDRKREQKTRILKWIAAPNKTETLHDSFVRKRGLCPDSGRWLYKRYDAVSNWMREDPPRDSTLWVHGPRGMGKTILASLVVTRLRELIREGRVVPPGAQVGYFYCQEGDQDMATYLGILRSLLHQFVSAADEVMAPDPTDHGDDGDVESNNTSRTKNNNNNNNATILPLCADKITNSGGSSLSSPEAALPLLEAFFDINPRQYLVVDGLDECAAPAEVQQAVAFLEAQVTRCEDVSQGSLRVLFVSAASADVRRVMAKHGVPGEGGREVPLDVKNNAQDIRGYVRKRLEPAELAKANRRFNLTEANVQVIEDQVAVQSEGVFLYAELAMEYLVKQMTKRELLEKVKPGMLPDQLSTMYDTLLGTLKDNLTQLSPEHWAKAKLLLGWLVCAHRPLKWHEIQAILAFDPDHDAVDFDLRMIRTENVSDFLGSLVQVLPGDNIRLIHSTAKRHLVNTEHINDQSVQCDLAILCLRYLSLRCFAAPDYTEAERREHILQGYFSFQDYAASQWYKHIDSVITSCRDVFLLPVPAAVTAAAPSSPSSIYTHHLLLASTSHPATTTTTTIAQHLRRDHYVAAFTSALDRFTSAYDQDLEPSASPPHPDLPLDSIAAYSGLPFYRSLHRLWKHILAHQRRPVEDRNKIGIPRLDAALALHRAAIETTVRPSTAAAVGADTIELYYGPNLYKCHRTLCVFFHRGFDARLDRDAHQARHDRPYRCPLDACDYAPFGFSSNKDKDRHVRNYHAELSDAPSAFLQMSRRVEPAKFRCNMCPKTFTRNINLKGHERSHFGERPYACSSCGKAFARLNDCRRHERIHMRRG
ncbi:C2H2 finger domain transcription factor crzA, partial [Colletotrichum shisoi]